MKKVSDNDAINKHLAEKVMGWTTWIATKNGHDDLNDAYTDGVKHKIEISDWNPAKDDGQAMMCIRKFNYDGWEIFVEGDVIKVVIYDDDYEMKAEVYAREEAEGELTLAISLACAKATGWKEKNE